MKGNIMILNINGNKLLSPQLTLTSELNFENLPLFLLHLSKYKMWRSQGKQRGVVLNIFKGPLKKTVVTRFKRDIHE